MGDEYGRSIVASVPITAGPLSPMRTFSGASFLVISLLQSSRSWIFHPALLSFLLDVKIPVRLGSETLGEKIDKGAHLEGQELAIRINRKDGEIVGLPVRENVYQLLFP